MNPIIIVKTLITHLLHTPTFKLDVMQASYYKLRIN